MKNKDTLNHIWISFGFVLGVFIFLWVNYPPFYASNDDMTLQSIVSGAYSGTPDAHGIYIMAILAGVWKCLYSLLPQVPWYGIFMAGLHLFGSYVIVYRAGAVFSGLKKKCFVSLLAFLGLLLLDLKHMVLYQYTQLAGLLAAAAVVWILTLVFGEGNSTSEKNEGEANRSAEISSASSVDAKKHKLLFTLSLAGIFGLLLLTLWLRKQVFFMALPVVLLATCLRLLAGARERGEDLPKKRFLGKISLEAFVQMGKKILVPVLVFLCMVGLSFGVEKIAYGTTEWKAYLTFNEQRTNVYDYDRFPVYEENEDFYTSINVSAAEYTVLRENFLLLLPDGGESIMGKISDKGDAIYKEWEQYFSVPRHFLKCIYTATSGLDKTTPGILVALLFLLTAFLLLRNKRWTELILLAMGYVYKAVFLGYFTYKNRLPERITYCLFLLLFALLLGVVLQIFKEKSAALEKEKTNTQADGSELPLQEQTLQQAWKSGRRLPTIAIVCIAFAVVEMWQIDIPELKAAYTDAAEQKEKLQEVVELTEGNETMSFLLDSSLYSTVKDSVFGGVELPKNVLVAGDWLGNSPLSLARVTKLLGEGTSVAEAFCEGKLQYITYGDRNARWVEAYLAENRKTEVSLTTLLVE